MNSTVEKRGRFVEKEGLFTCLAEESTYRLTLLRRGSLLVDTMRHRPSDSVRNRTLQAYKAETRAKSSKVFNTLV
jgi:hypothetical protein